MSHHIRDDGDEGVALVLVLVFVTAIALVLTSVMAQANANLVNTTVVRGHDARTYASDGGVDLAIQELRTHDELCPDEAAGTEPVGTYSINGREVTVTCRAILGSVVGNGDTHAIITTDTDVGSTSFSTQGGGGGAPIEISNGHLYVAGNFDFSARKIILENGEFQHQDPPCAGPPPSGELEVQGPYGFTCTSNAPDAVLATIDADLPSVPADAPAPQTIGSCKVFYPGRYTSAPNLGGQNYFKSGVYYFHDIDIWSISNEQLYAGGQHSSAFPGETACADDTAPGAAAEGTGVLFVFGGASVMQVRNSPPGQPDARVAIFARSPGTGVAGATGIAIYAVPSSPVPAGVPAPPAGYAGWAPSGPAGEVLEVTTGNAQVIVDGLIYAPTGDVALFASHPTNAQLYGGVVAFHLSIQASAVPGALVISGVAQPGGRQVQITSTATTPGGVVPSEGDIVSTAVVEIGNDPARTAQIQSWRIQD